MKNQMLMDCCIDFSIAEKLVTNCIAKNLSDQEAILDSLFSGASKIIGYTVSCLLIFLQEFLNKIYPLVLGYLKEVRSNQN